MSDKLSKSFSHHSHQRCKSSLSGASRDGSPIRNISPNIRDNAPGAYKTADNSYQDVVRQKYSMSVKDIIRSRSKKNIDFGVEGYWIRNYNPYMDKPLGKKWVKNNIPDFWDMVKKRSMKTPSPDHYQK